jgi:mannosylglycerate hydrolase
MKLYTDKIAENFEHTWKSTDDSLSDKERLFLLGIDFSGAESDVNEILKIANAEIEDKEFKMSTLDDYIEALKGDIDVESLLTVHGELRDGPAPACSGNGLASRMYIKRKNKKVQNDLIYKAEPLMSAMKMYGNEYDAKMSELAWDYLLKSHPHDSINGVTQDKTANDEMYHLAQAEELADVLYQRGMRNYIKSLDLSGFNDKDLLLVVFNPLPFEREEIIKVLADAAENTEVEIINE